MRFSATMRLRVTLPRAINHAHPATPDLFQDLIIAQSPISVPDVNFAEDILERLCLVVFAVLTYLGLNFSRKALREQTAQAKSAFDARSRAALRTGE